MYDVCTAYDYDVYLCVLYTVIMQYACKLQVMYKYECINDIGATFFLLSSGFSKSLYRRWFKEYDGCVL